MRGGGAANGSAGHLAQSQGLFRRPCAQSERDSRKCGGARSSPDGPERMGKAPGGGARPGSDDPFKPCGPPRGRPLRILSGMRRTRRGDLRSPDPCLPWVRGGAQCAHWAERSNAARSVGPLRHGSRRATSPKGRGKGEGQAPPPAGWNGGAVHLFKAPLCNGPYASCRGCAAPVGADIIRPCPGESKNGARRVRLRFSRYFFFFFLPSKKSFTGLLWAVSPSPMASA